jgi:predicted phage terminase large subunit-like protein
MLISPSFTLSSSECDVLEKALALEWRRRIPMAPHTPTARQAEFLGLAVREALYGGAAGGGKSDALLMAALQHVDDPGYAAILFRRTFADLALPGALMDRAHGWLAGSGARWNERDKTWAFPSGASLSFGYLEHENDKYRYQGAEFQFIGFDELTQFTETQYRYMISRLRRCVGAEVPLRMRAASNPGGVGHEWVRQRFLIEGPEAGRVFVPAKLGDNPHLDREEYEKALNELDPVTLAQLRDGDWNTVPKGPMFDRSWFEIVDAAPVEGRRLRYWDFAATEAKAGKDPDWTVGVRMSLLRGVYHVEDVRRVRAKPLDVERLVKQTAISDGKGVEVVMEQEPGSSGIHLLDHYRRSVLVGWAVRGDKKTGNKLDLAKPLSSAAQAGNVRIVRGAWNRAWLDEVEAFPTEGIHDDQVDASSGAQRFLSDNLASFPDEEQERPKWPTRI